MARIEQIDSGHYRIEPVTKIADSMHGDILAFELNTVRIRDADGAEGQGSSDAHAAGHGHHREAVYYRFALVQYYEVLTLPRREQDRPVGL